MSQPLTASDLADALGYFSNTVINAMHHGTATECCIAQGIDAVTGRLAELAKSSGLETPRMLVLSTGHITYETSMALNNGTGTLPSGIGRRDHGWFIPIYDAWPGSPEEIEDGDDPVPADLIAIRDFAKSIGCTWICLDQDGDILTALPSYDW